MAKCKSCGSPLCSGCSAAHMKYDSPAKQMVDPTMQQQMIQPMTNVTPAGSSLVNPFSPSAQATAQGIYGNQQMKQMSVNAPFMYKDGSPLEGNAFIAAKIAAEKAGKNTFKVGGKTFPVK